MHADAQVGAAAQTSAIILNNSHEEETVLIEMSRLFVGHGDALLRQESPQAPVFFLHTAPQPVREAPVVIIFLQRGTTPKRTPFVRNALHLHQATWAPHLTPLAYEKGESLETHSALSNIEVDKNHPSCHVSVCIM